MAHCSETEMLTFAGGQQVEVLSYWNETQQAARIKGIVVGNAGPRRGPGSQEVSEHPGLVHAALSLAEAHHICSLCHCEVCIPLCSRNLLAVLLCSADPK